MVFYDEKILLEDARKNKYAVPGFFPFNLDFIKIIVDVCEEENSPVVICQGPEFIRSFGDEVFTQALITAAKNAKVPVSLSVDHMFETNEETVHELTHAIHLGWKSVMLDGSILSYEENLKLTKEVAKMCSKIDVTSVGALGEVRRFFPQASDYEGEFKDTYTVPEEIMTDPLQAKEFVENTGVDVLAISIGQYIRSLWDGEKPPYKKTARLNFDRLDQIAQATDAYLILQGASHVDESDLEKAAKSGVSMIKVASEQALIWANTLRETLDKDQNLMFPEDIQKPALAAVKESMRHYIRLFGSNNKA